MNCHKDVENSVLFKSPSLNPTASTRAELAIVDKRSCIRNAIATTLGPLISLDVTTTDNADSLLSRRPNNKSSVIRVIIIGDGALDGNQTVREIEKLVEYFPDAKQAVLTDNPKTVSYKKLSKLGVTGIIPSIYDIQQLALCVKIVCAGIAYFPPHIVENSCTNSSKSDDTKRIDKILTPRQQQIMDFIAIGRSNKFIAGELSLSESTVKIHVHNMMKHLGATNRTHATHIINKMRGQTHSSNTYTNEGSTQSI